CQRPTVGVAVPGDAIEHRVEHVDRDQADTAFDQAAGQQAGLAEGTRAVATAQVVLFRVQAKRLLGFRSEDPAIGSFGAGSTLAAVLCTGQGTLSLVDGRCQGVTIFKLRRVTPIRRASSRDSKGCLRWIWLHPER